MMTRGDQDGEHDSVNGVSAASYPETFCAPQSYLPDSVGVRFVSERYVGLSEKASEFCVFFFFLDLATLCKEEYCDDSTSVRVPTLLTRKRHSATKRA